MAMPRFLTVVDKEARSPLNVSQRIQILTQTAGNVCQTRQGPGESGPHHDIRRLRRLSDASINPG